MGSTRSLSSEQLNSELSEGIKDLWENSLFFDFTLEVEDETIEVHKVILASCSGYFRAMFNSSMKETKQKSANLKALASDSVKALMSYIYTGYLKISSETLEETLSAAHYLQVSSAVDLCAEFIIGDLSWETVFDAQHLAKTYALENVEEEVEFFMLRNFHEMPEEFMESVGKQVVDLTDCDALCVNSEYSLFEKLMSFKSVLSEDDFYEALGDVRYPLMSKDELDKVTSTGLMTTRLSHLMDEAWEYHKDVIKQPLLQTERTQVRSDNISTVFANSRTITGHQENEIIQIISFPFRPEEFDRMWYTRRVGIAVWENFLFVCDSLDVPDGPNYTGLFRYDPRFNSWLELKPLLDAKRRDCPLLIHESNIFAIGGRGTTSMEIYDIGTNVWRYGTSINYSNPKSAGVVIGDKIYVCGGETVEDDDDGGGAMFMEAESCVKTLSCYDTASETWQFKAPMLERRVRHLITALDEKIYVFAGNNGHKDLDTVEYYVPESNQWTSILHKLPNPIVGVCSDDSDIFVLKRTRKGKEDIPDTVMMTFDRFDTETGCTDAADDDADEVLFVIPSLFHYDLPIMCTSLYLPFKLR